MKRAFSLVEIIFVLFVLATVFFTVIPLSLSNVKQAKFISDWKNYMEQVIYSYETLSEYKKNYNIDEKASIKRLLHYLDAKPAKLSDKNIKNYKYRMLNSRFYKKNNIDSSTKVYSDINGHLMWVEYTNKAFPIAMVWVDLNGYKNPNIVGKDIFVYEIYKDSVSPYGKNLNMKSIKADCSRLGTGMACSQFFILGGNLK